MNVKSVRSGHFSKGDNMFDLKKPIAMGFHPMTYRSQCSLLGPRLILRHHEDIAVKLRELIRVISAEIGKEEPLDSGRRFRAEANRVAIAMGHFTPAVNMKRFRRSPPLATKALKTILHAFAHREPHIVKFGVWRLGFSSNIEREKFHGRAEFLSEVSSNRNLIVLLA
jgi:hypothetical protein